MKFRLLFVHLYWFGAGSNASVNLPNRDVAIRPYLFFSTFLEGFFGVAFITGVTTFFLEAPDFFLSYFADASSMATFDMMGYKLIYE